MGESACLRRSLSHPSAAFRLPPEGDPSRCLTESVSFGRFVSESLDWERWSAFSHNRYLEEVQQISKAGSVAEKKAFFEAHYKRRAAIKGVAELERANVGGGSDPTPSTSRTMETVNVVVPGAEIDHSADVKCVLDVGRCCRVESDETGVVGSVNVEISVQLEDQMQVRKSEPRYDLKLGTSGGTSSGSLADLQSAERVNVVVPDASADVKCVLDVDHSDGVVGSVSVDPSVHLEDQMQVGNVEAGSNPESGTSDRTCGFSLASLQSVETVNLMDPDTEIEDSADVKCVIDIGQRDQVEEHGSVEVGTAGIGPSVNLGVQTQVGHADTCPTNKVAMPKERTAHEDACKKESVALRASKSLTNPSRIPNTNKAPKLPRASVKRETFESTKASSPTIGRAIGSLISKKNSVSKTVHMSIIFSSCPGEKIRMSTRKSKVESTTSWNPTTASVHGLAPGTSKPEQFRRHNLTVNKSISGTRGMLQTATRDRSRSSISNGSKATKPVTVSSPFRFRSEEQAAKRREKLEERCNATNEPENIHQEGKQRCVITKTQQRTNYGSRLDEALRRTQTTRMSVVSPQPPKSGRKPASSVSVHAPSQRTLECAALLQRNRVVSRSVASLPQQRKKGHENASPNIQS